MSDYYRGLPEPGTYVPPSSEPSPPRWVNPEDAETVPIPAVVVERGWRGPTWEYRTARFQPIGSVAPEVLTLLGAEGWELVAVVPDPAPPGSIPPSVTCLAYFKRPGPDVDPLTGRAWCS